MAKVRILVVGGEGHELRTIKRQLEHLGYEVPSVVSSGQAAVERAERERADLVLVDIESEGATDAVTCAEEIEERLSIPVVYLISCVDHETLQRAKVSEPFDYILSPADERELHSVVEMTLYKHRMERTLRENEETYRNVVERANDGIVIVQEKRIRYANPRLGEILGYSVEELLDTPFADFVRPQDRAKVVDRYERRMAGETIPPIYEVGLERRDGSVVRVELNAGITTYHGGPADLAMVRDVTDRERLEQEVRKRQLYLEGVLESAPDAIVALDTEHRILEWNPGAEQLFGYLSAEAIGRDLDTLIAKPSAEIYEQAKRFTRRVLDGEAVPRTEGTRYCKDGSAVDVILAGAPIQIEDELVGVVAVYTDITERKRAEEALRRRKQQLEALQDVGLDIVSELNLDELLRSIVSRAIDLVDATGGGFDLYCPEQDTLDFSIEIGYDALPSDTAVARGEGLAGKIWEAGQTILVEDYATWEGRSEAWADCLGHAADMGVPVQWGDEFLGVLEVMAEAPRRFSQDDAHLLELFATQAAIAIRNARMYEETQKRTAQLETLQRIYAGITAQLDLEDLLRSIVEQGCRLLNATGGSLYLVDETEGNLKQVVSHGYKRDHTGSRLASGEGTAGRVWKDGEPLVVDNYQDWEGRSAEWEDEALTASMAVPLEHGDRIIGTLGFDELEKPGRFDENDVWISSLFANQASTAIHNARLHEELHQRAVKLTAVNRVAQAVSTYLHVDDLLKAVYREVQDVFGADAFFLALHDKERDELDFRLSVDEGTLEPPRRRPVEPGLTASVVVEGEPLLIRDYEQERDGLPPAETWGTDKISRSWLGVPMRAAGEVMGVISVQAYRPFAYDDEDQQLLTTIADQVAVAVEQARLYEESQRRATQAALLSEAGRHVSSELEPEVLLDTIVSAVRDAFDYHNVILLLRDEEDGEDAGRGRLQMQSIAGAYVDILPSGLSLAIGEGMIGYAAASGETQLSNDVSTDPHYVRKATENTKSELVVPIKSGDRVIGVLDIQDDELDAFDRLDVTTLETLSTQIAAAIENARLFQAERERSAQLATVSKVTEGITAWLDPDEVLHRAVEMITEAFGYYYASIMLLDEERGDLVFKAGAGGFAGRTPFHFRQAVGEGMIGWVADRGETRLANDVSQEPLYIPAYLDETKSELDVPLKYRDKVIGVLDLQSSELNAFNEHDVIAMEALAGHVAAAIENARLFAVAQQRVAELRAVRQASLQLTSTLELEPVLETILEHALNLVSADDAHVFLYDGGLLTFGAAMWDGERHEEPFETVRPHGLTYSVARQGERIVVSDAVSHHLFEDRQWEGAIVGLPLTVGDEVQGVMNIAYQRPHRFTDEELWVLDLLADQAAIAVRNARLYDEVRDRALEQETLREAALALTTALERDEVVERVLAQLQRVVPYDTASVLLLRDDHMDIVGGRGFSNLSEIVGLSFPLNEEHPNRDVIRTREPIVLEDAPEVYKAFEQGPHAAAGIRSWLGVPMLVGDRIIGMIALDKRQPGFYTREHARLAQAFTAQAAVAFENARLYEAEQEQRELSERLRETALLLNRSLDLQEVLEMILEQLASVIDYDSGSVQILEDGATEVIAARNLPEREIGRSYALEHYAYNRRLIEEAKPIVIGDTREESQGWREAEGLEHVRANIGVPLQVRDQVIGILTVDSRHPEAYTGDDARLVQAFAQQAAVAIENARLFEKERKQRRVSEALEAAAAAVGSTLELEAVLDRILEQVARVVDGDAFNVMLVENDCASVCRWRGYEQFGAEAFVSGVDFYLPEVPNLQQMSETREPMVIADTDAYEGWVDVPAQRWIRSYIGAPIELGDATVGYLNADSARPGQFDVEDARRLATFADHAATAIENARLYNEAQKRALEQLTLREAALAMTTALERDEVIERILAQLQEVVPYDTASVQLLQNHRLEIVGGRGFPNLEELLGLFFDLTREDNPNRTVVRTRQSVILEDTSPSYEAFQREPHAQAGIRSWLGVPMLVGDRLIGIITLDKKESGFYNQEHARLAEAFAAQAGIAIENAQLHQETVRQLAETEVLRETMLAAASTLDFDQVLARTIDVLEQAIGLEYLGFMLPIEEQSTGDMFMVSHTCMLGFDPPEEGYRFPVDDCMTGHVYQTGEPKILSDVRDEGPYAVASADVRSELAVPVKVGDEVVAVLNLESSRLDAFDERDLAFYTAIAGQLGIAMENAQLFEAERRQRQLSEALEKAAVAVSSTLELDQVLDRILEQVEQVVPGDSFNIMLIEDGQAYVVRWRGYEKLGVAEEVSGYSAPVSEHPYWVKMSRTGKPVVIPDTTLDDDWQTRQGWDWLRSYVAAPIRVGDTTVGFLNVDGTEPGQFSSRDTHRLETFASHAATAIENARLYERLRDHAETLESRVAERTAQLQGQYARLEAILDSTVDGIVVIGPDGELVLANPVAREWLTQTLSPSEASLLRETVRDLADRAVENPERVLELKGLDLQLRAATIQEPGVEGAAAVVAIHDISHLKALDRMKSRFVSNVSHELRTPIATIKLFAHLMRKQPEKWREYLEPLAQEAEHQADLVEDILEISRVDAGRLEINRERTNLESLVDMVVTNSRKRAQERGLKLRHELMDARSPAPVSLVDAQRITQVLDNLINNAIRYTSEGGEIAVWTDTSEVGGRGWVTVTVEDTGMGIPEDELHHIFERFFRGEKPRTMQISGTGLGLAIVKEIVELHGGRVTVESEVNEGSRFTVWLPLAG